VKYALCLVCLLLAQLDPVRAQEPMTYRDSIFQRYMKDGAWRLPLFSKERADLVDSALSYLPQDAYLWQQRAMPLAKQGKYEVAIQYLDSAVKYDSIHWIDYRAFLKCIFQKSHRAALEDFKVASRIHPGGHVMDHEFDYYRGLSFLMLNVYDSAEQCFRRCITSDRAFGEQYVEPSHAFYLGVVLYELSRYQTAVECFQQAIGRYERFSDAKYYLALCQLKMGNASIARALLLEARKDLREGFTLNDQNTMYERYPYQIEDSSIEDVLADIKERSE
jgi:tetratricopeptide (TPR) repeat protein